MSSDRLSLRQQRMQGFISDDDLPFEKFKKSGVASMTDAELIAVFLRCGTKKRTPMDIGQEIVRKCRLYENGIGGFTHLTAHELSSIDGIGQIKAIQLCCISELSRRIAEDRGKARIRLDNSQNIAGCYMERLRHELQERTLLLSLNARYELLNEEVLYIGTTDRCNFEAKDVFRQALMSGARYIVLLHNHPSGDSTPSTADIRVTRLIYKLGESLGISLYDHIIIGGKTYLSFREHNLLHD